MLVLRLVEAAAGGDAVAWGEGRRGVALRVAMARAAGPVPLPMARATPGPCSSRPLAACWSIGRAVLRGRPAGPLAGLLGLRGAGGEGNGGWGREGLREAHLAILPYSPRRV